MNLILLALLTLTLPAEEILPSTLLPDNPHVNTYRYMIAQKNLQLIQTHNQGDSTFKMKAYPQFIALTIQQMSAYYVAPLAESQTVVLNAFKNIADNSHVPKPKGAYLVDLRKDFNTTVRLQGFKCVNAYAYVVADLMDMLSNKSGIGWGTISPQSLTDCSSDASLSADYRNAGCGGGLLNKTLDYALNRGVHELGSYPISADSVSNGSNQTCRNLRSTRRRIGSFIKLQDNNPNARATALKNGRPVAAAIAAANNNFRFYKSGIIDNCGNDTKLNHAVIILGFSYNPQYGNYWIVKNSWGTAWGQKGYARIEMGESCGLMVKGYVAKIELLQ